MPSVVSCHAEKVCYRLPSERNLEVREAGQGRAVKALPPRGILERCLIAAVYIYSDEKMTSTYSNGVRRPQYGKIVAFIYILYPTEALNTPVCQDTRPQGMKVYVHVVVFNSPIGVFDQSLGLCLLTIEITGWPRVLPLIPRLELCKLRPWNALVM